MTPYASGKRWALWHGNALDIAPTIAGVDALVSDPPYGMKWNPDCRRFSGGEGHRRANGDGGANRPRIVGDDKPFNPAPWVAYPRVALFGANHFGARLPVGTALVWLKRNPAAFGTFLSDAEIAWMKGGHGVYCYLDPNRGADRIHPNQKPVGVMTWVLSRVRVPAGGLVLDPYTGSASTGVAAIRMGLRFAGIEVDPAHLDGAARRLEQAEADGVQVALVGGAA